MQFKSLVVREPVTRGALVLFPVHSSAPAAPEYLAGPAAEAAGVLGVMEQDDGADVNSLVVHNKGALPVLLVEGETVIGAKQNRTLAVSVLVAAASTVDVPVSCVEAGRWGHENLVTRSSRHVPSDLRRIQYAGRAAARRACAGVQTDQGGVWDRVAAYQSEFAAASGTGALEDVYVQVGPELDALLAGVAPEPDQHGVIVAVGGKVRGIDLFDKPSTLAAYWDGLVAGYALDALRTPAADVTVADAQAFLDRLDGAVDDVSAATGLGFDHDLAGDGVAGHALEWEGAHVHLAAFATDGGGGPGRVTTTRRIDRRRWFE